MFDGLACRKLSVAMVVMNVKSDAHHDEERRAKMN